MNDLSYQITVDELHLLQIMHSADDLINNAQKDVYLIEQHSIVPQILK